MTLRRSATTARTSRFTPSSSAEGAEEFDTHAYAKAEFKSGPQFESKLKFYQSKYLSRLNDAAQA